MSNYKNIRSTLVDSAFHYEESTTEAPIKMNFSDKIIVKNISDDKITFEAERQVNFTPLKESFFKATFLASIMLDEPITKEQFLADVKKGLPMLSNVFSRISLVISELSNPSPFGPIITPPIYDAKGIVAE